MSQIKTVVPVNVATYRAVQMDTSDPGTWSTIAELAKSVGAGVQGWRTVRRKGAETSVYRIISNTRKTYDLADKNWLIILGTSGAMRVCSDRQFKHDYKEIDSE